MYTKIFVSIYDGSLRKDWKALVTFQQLLILADKEGFVDMTIDAIISRTTIPENIIVHGIEELMKPDPKSRSRDEQGRRILLISPERDWGWRIVNYDQYRNICTQDELRAYWRGLKKAERQKKNPTRNPNETRQPVNPRNVGICRGNDGENYGEAARAIAENERVVREMASGRSASPPAT